MEVNNNSYNNKISNILLIDDSPDDIRELKTVLNRKNIYIFSTSVEESVLEILEKKPPDLILLSNSINNLTGLELCRKIQEKPETKNIPIIFLVSKINPDEISTAFDAGVVDYIIKPFNPIDISIRINTHLKLKHLRDQIVEKNKELLKLNSEKNELLGIAAHDLKNPINNISMLAKVMRDEKDLKSEEIQEFSQDIVDTSDRMLELISTLLDLNKIEQGEMKLKPELVDVNEVITLLITSYKDRAAKKDITIHFRTSQKHSYINSDRNAFIQILDNLISNAIKFTPYEKNIYIKLKDKHEYIHVEVIDEGPGMNEDDKKKLFGKFAKLSAKPTGDETSTGLGLSIVKKYIDMMDGTVWCDSEPGEGATFIFEIPKLLDDDVRF